MCKNSKVKIVMYHYIRDLNDSRYPKIKGLDYRLFKQQIEFFNRNFNVVTMEQVIAAKNESYELPENAVILTFDDGYIDHFTFAFPILSEYKMQGSFFIPGKTFVEHALLDVNKIHFILASDGISNILKSVFEQMDYYRGDEFNYESNEKLFKKYAVASRFDPKEVIFVKRILQTVLPEKLRNIITSYMFEQYVGIKEEVFARELYMNKEQIKCMKDNGMYIGLHGYDHYWLGSLDNSQLKEDITKALDCMSNFIDAGSWVMNYPYGSYNDDVIKYISENGCKLGLSTDVRIADLSKDTIFALPRLDTNDFPPKSENYENY
ncbi:polysaccharide deacetylase family protein [Clostridium kluyveri]|uniref:polysaccharide deacetylase family protein n=1 Tax=Clostridium kluyveri TaxID=1534 RepID=UPI00224509A2|nr:polysaccharide deacetylase family protein [Clostridium kluyveri]UZQ50530.1 polysaccharide deacetylase family protein [Clostridium kluyveri]